MGNSAKKRQAANLHNEARSERLALEKDKRENPEKYQRKRRVKTRSPIIPFLATALAISPNAFDQRLSKNAKGKL